MKPVPPVTNAVTAVCEAIDFLRRFREIAKCLRVLCVMRGYLGG